MDNEVSTYVKEEIQEIMPNYDEAEFPSLDALEILFIYKYISFGGNALVSNKADREAARDAYLEVYGESNVTRAKAKGLGLLKKKQIRDAIDKMQGIIFECALKSFPMKIMSDIEALSNIHITDFYNDNGMAKDLGDIPKDKAEYIEDIRHTVNPKTGAVIIEYVIPKKASATSRMIELLKMKGMTEDIGGKGDESSAKKEAKEMRDLAVNAYKLEVLGLSNETKKE